ncbi:MAG: patatin family protein [Treponema sp.]|nr:patatin family protein [Treponema sp.]
MDIKKTGLVLEGGAMRGMFTCGVLDVLLENDIKFDGAIGVSAGASFGCNYKSKQIGRAIRYNCRYAHDSRYCSFASLISSGNLYNADFCYNKIPNELDVFDYETYRNNPMEFWIVATNVNTGLPFYKKLDTCDKKELDYMRASASMPLVSKIVELDGEGYLDGGISDSIPLKYFESIGYEKNLVILTQPEDFVKKPNKAMPLIRFLMKKYPKMIEAMENRHIMYNDETKYVFNKAKEKNTFVICPPESLGISRTEKNVNELRRIYQIGRNIALNKLDEIKAFLSDN